MRAQTWRFVRDHWAHLLVAPLPCLTVVTLLHELAHAAAARAQGGTVYDLVFLPDAEALGYMTYDLPAGGDHAAVLLAPYLAWTTLAGALGLLAFIARPVPQRLARLWFVWGIAVPLADVACAVTGYLLGMRNDLTHAFGPANVDAELGLVLAAGLAGLFVFAAQRRLYRERSLGPGGFVVVCAGVGVLACVAQVAIGLLPSG